MEPPVIHHVLRVILYAIVTASVLAGPSLATPAKEAPWLPEAAAYRLTLFLGNLLFDKLFKKARSTFSIKEQEEIVRKLNQIATTELPLLPLVHTRNFFAYHPWLKNYLPSGQIGGMEKYFDIIDKNQ